jgi:hypothetical protein
VSGWLGCFVPWLLKEFAGQPPQLLFAAGVSNGILKS